LGLGVPLIAFDEYVTIGKDEQAKLLTNMVKDTHRPFGSAEVLDVFMHYQIMHYLKKEKPLATFLSYGDTDEFAHEGNYSYYLDGAHAFDKYVKDILDFVQSDADYKDHTTILITTDHGRGDKIKSQWTSHGQKVLDSKETWYVMMGKGVEVLGEVSSKEQTYTKDLIHKVSDIMGLKFKSEKK
jgi:bisphosphoglycerate-independent phosphoglycerate mutase (AlkP superfamily)